MQAAIRRQPDTILAEFRELLGLACSLPSIHRVLVRMGMIYKKTLRASEQDRPDVQEARTNWAEKIIGHIPRCCFVIRFMRLYYKVIRFIIRVKHPIRQMTQQMRKCGKKEIQFLFA